MAQKQNQRAKITGFGFTLIGVLAITVFMFFNFKTVVVTGNSMEPTYTDKERVLVSKAFWLVGNIKPKDVIVFRNPGGEEVIKRVYGLPGDKIDFFNTPDDWNIAAGEYVVPPGKYYVLGDNREVSEDSRKFGPIEMRQILGKVIANR